jgi:hypothetical protein
MSAWFRDAGLAGASATGRRMPPIASFSHCAPAAAGGAAQRIASCSRPWLTTRCHPDGACCVSTAGAAASGDAAGVPTTSRISIWRLVELMRPSAPGLGVAPPSAAAPTQKVSQPPASPARATVADGKHDSCDGYRRHTAAAAAGSTGCAVTAAVATVEYCSSATKSSGSVSDVFSAGSAAARWWWCATRSAEPKGALGGCALATQAAKEAPCSTAAL